MRSLARALSPAIVVLASCGGGDGGSSAPDTEAPSVAITAPTPGASVSGEVTVSAAASDNESVAGVRFELDGEALGPEDTEAPYQVIWQTNGAAEGSHTLRATARDPSGNIGASDPVEITVAAAPTGAIRVVAATSGTGTDPDGYTVSVDLTPRGRVDANGSLMVEGLTLGAHTVTLAGISSFCTLAGEPTRPVTAAAEPVTQTFALTCDAAPGGRIVVTVAVVAGGPLEIRTIGADGSGETTIAPDGDYATWSPDGTLLAFIRYGVNLASTLFRVNADGSGLTAVAALPSNAGELDWGPNGTLVFSASRPQTGGTSLPDLYYIEADGSNLRPVFAEAGYRLSPVWSPDGTRLAFADVHPDGDHADLSLVNADGSSVEGLTTGTFDASATWSPDGTKLAFHRGNFDTGVDGGIWVIGVDGSNPHQLTDYPGPQYWPSWSPDGEWVVFTSENASGQPLLIARSDGSEVKEVPGSFQFSGQPEWGAGTQ